VIGPDGSQLGIKTLPDALNLARQVDLDLVEVAPLANPPVCRVMDYGKYRYEESQKAKESRKKATHISIKEVKFRPKIGSGDFDTKLRHIVDFLNEGHKVKVTLQFRGREMAHPELGARVLKNVEDQIGEIGKVEAHPRLDGRNMTMVLAPDKKAPVKKTTPAIPVANDSKPAAAASPKDLPPVEPAPIQVAASPSPAAPAAEIPSGIEAPAAE
jgi:translation initiation factor IF-3